MSTLVLIGRILYGGTFILLGLNNFARLNEKTDLARSKGVPIAKLSVILSSALIILGGLSILLGYRIEIGIAVLAVFLVPTSLMMHSFWAEEDPQARQVEMVQFFKNVALLGAALTFLGLSQPWAYSLGG